MVDNKCGNKSASIDLSQYFTDNISREKKKEFFNIDHSKRN